MAAQVLVIEDDTSLNQLFHEQIQKMGYRVNCVRCWSEAEAHLGSHEPDLILLDGRLPDASGIDLLPSLAGQYPVILLTAYGNVRDAVTAIRAGASEYLTKPVNLDELEMILGRVLETEKLKRDNQYLKNTLGNTQERLLVGSSAAIGKVCEQIDLMAPNDMTVLIRSESGTGKELVAKEMHFKSGRAARCFVALDCCTVQDSLFESELFGYEKGAFTGAHQKKIGLIEAADGGTLFLDEIGEITAAAQAKLLRVLETRRFRRVGGTKDIEVDVRIIAATNRDLDQMVTEGNFRSDLYYRLNALSISVPPLRERREDIPELASHFILHHGFSKRIEKKLSAAAMRRLMEYNWPGNVRELKNVVERAIILSGDAAVISPIHLGLPASRLPDDVPAVELRFDHEPTLDDVEKQYLEILLRRHSGYRRQVAAILGVGERSVYRMIDKFKLDH
jgi:DNA-binding NtrC family response regulator